MGFIREYNLLTSSVNVRYYLSTQRKAVFNFGWPASLNFEKIHERLPNESEVADMSPVTLYKRQKEILNYISQYIQKNGSSPTLQEIADAMGLSSLATVHEHLQTLVKKGVIRRFEGTVRGIEVMDQAIDATLHGIQLPLVGYIAAGEPIEALENPLETVTVAADLVSRTKRCYVLQVKGDSMINEGIFNGDHVIIQQQETARDGEIVVALLHNEFATLKTFYREPNGKIRLQPANDSMDPIYEDPENIRIQGRVTGVIRRYI